MQPKGGKHHRITGTDQRQIATACDDDLLAVLDPRQIDPNSGDRKSWHASLHAMHR
jgi:hypothetical protein